MKFNPDLMEREISREIVFEGRVFDIAKCHAVVKNGDTVRRDIMLHNGGVGVLPLDADNHIILVQQYRYGASCFLWEIPAGKLEKGEDPFKCAVRELEEETGYTTDDYTYLGKLNPSPAIMSEVIHLYLAKNLQEGVRHLDEDEFLEIERVPFDMAYQMVMNGEITDAKTQIAILKAKALLSL